MGPWKDILLYFCQSLFLFSLVIAPTSFAKDEQGHQDDHDENQNDELSAHEDKLIYSKRKMSYNFGLVIHNQDYSIYRSSMLGQKGINRVFNYLKDEKLPLPKTIIYMNKDGYKKNFPFFKEDALEEYDLQKKYGFRFFHSYHYDYRTYLDGKNPYFPEDDIDKSKYLNNKAIKIFGLKKDNTRDGDVEAFLRILKLVLDKNNQPVLFHCLGGRHRTGMIGMAIRYLQGGEWIDGQKRKIFVLPYFKVLELNPAQYEYALHNRELFRMDNIRFIEKFSQDPRFLALKDEFAQDLNQVDEETMKSLMAESQDSLDGSAVLPREEGEVLRVYHDENTDD